MRKDGNRVDILCVFPKWVMHYSSNHQILLVGEGDFSFSSSLALSFGSASNIVASSLDPYEVLIKKYKNAKSNLENLHNLGGSTLHGVDANKMKLDQPDLKMLKFDTIIFNFPHAGFHGKEGDARLIMMHKRDVEGFFRNASGMLRAEGEIHVNHKTSAPFCNWNIEELALKNSLVLVEVVDFKIEDYPGYNNKRGDGGRCDEPFPLGKCSTFKFRFSTACKKMSEVTRHGGYFTRKRSQQLLGIPIQKQSCQTSINFGISLSTFPVNRNMNGFPVHLPPPDVNVRRGSAILADGYSLYRSEECARAVNKFHPDVSYEWRFGKLVPEAHVKCQRLQSNMVNQLQASVSFYPKYHQTSIHGSMKDLPRHRLPLSSANTNRQSSTAFDGYSKYPSKECARGVSDIHSYVSDKRRYERLVPEAHVKYQKLQPNRVSQLHDSLSFHPKYHQTGIHESLMDLPRPRLPLLSAEADRASSHAFDGYFKQGSENYARAVDDVGYYSASEPQGLRYGRYAAQEQRRNYQLQDEAAKRLHHLAPPLLHTMHPQTSLTAYATDNQGHTGSSLTLGTRRKNDDVAFHGVEFNQAREALFYLFET